MGRHAEQALMEYILRVHCLFGGLIPKSREFVVVTVKNTDLKKRRQAVDSANKNPEQQTQGSSAQNIDLHNRILV